MSVDAIILMVAILGFYVGGSFYLLNKVFQSQQKNN